MPRSLTPAMQTALRDLVVRPCWLVKIQFNNGYVYLTSRDTDITWNSQIWTSNSWLRSIDGLTNVFDHSYNEVSVILGGLDSNILSLVLGQTSQKNICEIYFAMLNSSNTLIADPYLIFNGLFDDAEIDDAIDETEVRLIFTTEMAKIGRINVFRFTHESQKALFPGDLGFQYVSQAADWKGLWGKSSVPSSNQKRKRNTAK